MAKAGKGQGYLYRRLVWLTLVSFCVPTILAGLLLYYRSIYLSKEQFFGYMRSSISIVDSRLEKVQDTVERDILKLAGSRLVLDSFSPPGLEQRIPLHFEILEEIGMRKNTNDYIGEIYYYNQDSSLVLSNRYGGHYLDEFPLYANEIGLVMGRQEQAGWIYGSSGGGEKEIRYYRHLPMNLLGQSGGLFCVELDPALLRRYLFDDLFSESCAFFLYNAEGQLMLHAGPSGEGEPSLASFGHQLNTILERGDTEGYFQAADAFREKILFTYYRKPNGHLYIAAIPRAAVLSHDHWSRRFLILACGLFLCCGTALALLSSRRVYNPIRQLVHHGADVSKGKVDPQSSGDITFLEECITYLSGEIDLLSGYISELEPTAREKFLMQVINEECRSPEGLKRDCEKYAIPFQAQYVVVWPVPTIWRDMLCRDSRRTPSQCTPSQQS